LAILLSAFQIRALVAALASSSLVFLKLIIQVYDYMIILGTYEENIINLEDYELIEKQLANRYLNFTSP
jgi:hypothetical protein